MHLRKCLTFGVHIICAALFIFFNIILFSAKLIYCVLELYLYFPLAFLFSLFLSLFFSPEKKRERKIIKHLY